MKSPSERRKFERIPYIRPLTVELGSSHYNGIGVDISNDGLGLIAECAPKRGDVMKVSFPVTVGTVLPVLAEVMWSTPLAENMRIGTRFI